MNFKNLDKIRNITNENNTNLDCSSKYLSSLEGIPQKINGDLILDYNYLKSLKYVPQNKKKSYHEMYENVNKKFERNITEETFFNILVSNFGKNKFINEEIISILFKKFHFELKDLKQSKIDKTEINIIHNLLDKKLKFKDYEVALINQMKLNLTMNLFDEETQKKLKNDDIFLRDCYKHTFEKEKTFNNFIKNYNTKNDLDLDFQNKFNYVLENIKIINDMIKNNNIVKHHHHEFY